MAAHDSQIAETSIFTGLPQIAFDATWSIEWFRRVGGRTDALRRRCLLSDLASVAGRWLVSDEPLVDLRGRPQNGQVLEVRADDLEADRGAGAYRRLLTAGHVSHALMPQLIRPASSIGPVADKWREPDRRRCAIR